jgi:hypothetical protein
MIAVDLSFIRMVKWLTSLLVVAELELNSVIPPPDTFKEERKNSDY